MNWEKTKNIYPRLDLRNKPYSHRGIETGIIIR
jgi:hypothetical protein